MDDDCIVISDDEDVQLIKHVVNLEPVTIDLTKNDTPQPERRQNPPNFGEPEFHDESMESEEPDTSEDSETESERMQHPEEPEAPMEPEEPEDQEEDTVPEEQERQEERIEPEVQDIPEETPPPEQPKRHDDAEMPHGEQAHWPHQFDMPNRSHVPKEPKRIEETENPQRVEVRAKPDKPPMSDHELMMVQKTLGNEKYRHNLFDDAIRIYKRANQLAKQLGDNEMSAILHFNLAMTYYKLGSYDQAADECANAVKINDNYMKAHLKRAEIYQRQCKYEEAVICYEHICDLDSSNRDYAILLKQARDRAKLMKKNQCYSKVLGLNPNFTKEDLKKAYRQKALSHHPDRHSDADIVTRKIEEKRFKDASEAHSYIQVKFGYTR